MRIDGWACDLLWHAVWNPTGIGVHDAQVARAWMDRTGSADYDPAMSDLPGGRYASVDEFKRTDGPALLRRLRPTGSTVWPTCTCNPASGDSSAVPASSRPKSFWNAWERRRHDS